MDEAYHTLLIHHHLGWHASQLEQVDFLTVPVEHADTGIRQTDEGQVVFLPVRLELVLAFWADYDHLGLAGDKLVIVLAQLRHMRTAEWSGKTTVENHHHVLVAAEIRKAHWSAPEIGQCKIGGGDVGLDS